MLFPHPEGNYVLDDIVTPIDIEKYEYYLHATGFDAEKSEFLLHGFRNGFDIGYRGPLQRRDLSNNLPITVGLEGEIWEKLMKEVKLGRHAGLYESIPYDLHAISSMPCAQGWKSDEIDFPSLLQFWAR